MQVSTDAGISSTVCCSVLAALYAGSTATTFLSLIISLKTKSWWGILLGPVYHTLHPLPSPIAKYGQFAADQRRGASLSAVIRHTDSLSLCHSQVRRLGAGFDTSTQSTPKRALSRSKSPLPKPFQPACASTSLVHRGASSGTWVTTAASLIASASWLRSASARKLW